MISFAQNFEDVVLERALGDIQKGFYVDVGAYHPRDDSVTKHFYEKGWSGINIEPIPEYLAQFHISRPRDVNLQLAVGDGAPVQLNFVNGTGLSTVDPIFARRAADYGYPSSTVTVATMPLRRVLELFGQPEIHFLKLDCEGSEFAALQSMDFKKFRPWIVLVEAVIPLAQTPCHQIWERILLSNAYKFVYFDGLNRFYLANERETMAKAFEAPPNVFDNFVRVREFDLEEQVAALQKELSLSKAQANEVGQGTQISPQKAFSPEAAMERPMIISNDASEVLQERVQRLVNKVEAAAVRWTAAARADSS